LKRTKMNWTCLARTMRKETQKPKSSSNNAWPSTLPRRPPVRFLPCLSVVLTYARAQEHCQVVDRFGRQAVG
jgi:hypothetical protein